MDFQKISKDREKKEIFENNGKYDLYMSKSSINTNKKKLYKFISLTTGE